MTRRNHDIQPNGSNNSEIGHQTRDRLTRKRERLNTELLNAIISSNLKTVNKLLNEGACPWARCRTVKSSSVHLAALCGQTDIVTELVKAGADLGMRDGNGVQAAHLAVWAGHIHILRLIFNIQPQLIHSPVMPTEIDALQDELDSWDHDHQSISQMMPVFELGSTVLHIACKLNKVEAVEYLLSEGADVHMKDGQGLTPLDVAGTCVADHQLINENDNSTILGKSGGYNYADHSANHDVPDCHEMPAESTDLDGAERDVELTANRRPSKSMFDVVSALFEGGARMQDDEEICFLGRHNWNLPVTALHTAVTNGDIDLIDYLLSKGASLLTMDEHGETPLHLAVRLTLLEPLKIVLSWLSLDLVDIKDGNGMTPLHQAVMQEWPSGIGLLLEAGADVTIPTKDNETVLHIAAKKGNDLLLEELLSIEDSLQVIDAVDIWAYTPLFRAVESKTPSCVKMLIKQGADMNIKLPGKKSLLHIAVDVMSSETLKILVGHVDIVEADINLLCDGNDGQMSPLHIAAQNGSVDCAKILIKAGADIFLRMTDIYGSTAAHLAACEGHYEFLATLISHNSICLNIRDLQGWCPLHIAARYGHGQCAILMLRHGANISVNIPDNAVTKSALDLIVEYVPKGINQLEHLFDSYIDLEACAVKDPSCLITLNYTLLLKKKSNHTEDNKQLAFFNTLLNSHNEQLKETLLLHPLTESFLYFKWMSMKNFFIILICLYIVYTISLTIFAMNTFVSYFPGLSLVFRIFSVILLIPIITSECLQASTLQRYYFIDDESWLRWMMVLSGGLVCLSHTQTILSRYLASLAVFLSWTELLFLFARFPAWGLHVLMFEKVASNVFQVLSRFVFLIFGFLFAFMIHFGGAPPFSNFWEALCKVFIMIVELDYSGVFNDSDADEGPLTVQTTLCSLFGRLMYVTFVVLVAMVMMNLIVGLCVSDIALLEVQGRTQRLAKQAAFLSFLEMSVYNKCLLVWLPSLLQDIVKDCRKVSASVTIFPNDPRCPLPIRLRRELLRRVKASKPAKQAAALVDLKLQQIDSNVNLLTQEMDEVKVSIQSVTSMLTSLIQTKNSTETIK